MNVPFHLRAGSYVLSDKGHELRVYDAARNGANFTTWALVSPERIPPEVLDVTPSPGATGVSVTTSIVADFSEPLNLSLISITLAPEGGTPVEGNLTYDATDMAVEFVPGVRYVSARVMTGWGQTVTMTALDSVGGELGSTTSVSAPEDLWIGTLSLGPTDADIASVEWWPSMQSAMVGVDDLSYGPVPEPATLALVGLGAVGLIARRRK